MRRKRKNISCTTKSLHWTGALLTVFLATLPGTSNGADNTEKETVLECKSVSRLCATVKGRFGCDTPEQHNYVIVWKGDAVRHLDDYGVFEYSGGCRVDERWIYCAEKTPPNKIVKNWSNRRTQFERSTGLVTHIAKFDQNEEAVDLDKKSFPNMQLEIQGECRPRADRKLF